MGLPDVRQLLPMFSNELGCCRLIRDFGVRLAERLPALRAPSKKDAVRKDCGRAAEGKCGRNFVDILNDLAFGNVSCCREACQLSGDLAAAAAFRCRGDKVSSRAQQACTDTYYGTAFRS